jgi:hypothetical protein
MESLQEIRERLTRIEDKLDSHLTTTASTTTDVAWVKSHLKYLWIVLLGVTGKLAHLTFLK